MGALYQRVDEQVGVAFCARSRGCWARGGEGKVGGLLWGRRVLGAGRNSWESGGEGGWGVRGVRTGRRGRGGAGGEGAGVLAGGAAVWYAVGACGAADGQSGWLGVAKWS